MTIDWNYTVAAVWRQNKNHLHPVAEIDPISLDSLIGIENQKRSLMENTERLGVSDSTESGCGICNTHDCLERKQVDPARPR